MSVMKKRVITFIAACGLAAVTPFAHSADRATAESIAATLRDQAIRGDSTAWDFVSELSTRFGPRPAGSASSSHR